MPAMTDDRLLRAHVVLDEREQLAAVASGLAGPAWKVLRDGVCQVGNLYSGWIIREGSYTTRAEAAHIAASDPATILREVAGWRALLNLHESSPFVIGGWPFCYECSDSTTDSWRSWPCPTVEAVLTALGVTP